MKAFNLALITFVIIIISFLIFNLFFNNTRIDIKDNMTGNEEMILNRELRILKKYEETELYDPRGVYYSNGNLLIRDIQSNQPLLLLDDDLNFISYIGHWGRGPGEISNPYRISAIKDNKIFIHDWTKKNIFIINLHSGEYLYSLDILKYLTYAHGAFICGNVLITPTKYSDEFANGFYMLDNEYRIEKTDTVIFGAYYQIPEMKYAKNNYLLKDGWGTVIDDQYIYFIFRSTSLILGFQCYNGDLLFKTLSPSYIELPNYTREGFTAAQPPINWFPQANMGIGTDSKYLYIIYSGTILSDREALSRERDHELNHGRILHVYEKLSGKYRGSFRLPVLINDIAVSENYIFATSQYPDITVYKFEKPEI